MVAFKIYDKKKKKFVQQWASAKVLSLIHI